MAKTKQAKKRAVQNERDRARNRQVRTRVRAVVRDLRTTALTDAAKTAEMLPATAAELDRAAKKGVLHARTASFVHPVRRELVLITADPPDDPLWNAAMERWRGMHDAGRSSAV